MSTLTSTGNPEAGSDAKVAKGGVSARKAQDKNFAEAFAQIVAVLMRDRNFRNAPIGELEWLVLPPLMHGQFALAHSSLPQPETTKAEDRKNGKAAMVPVAVALWAQVSSNVDKALSDIDAPLKLQPADWTSGKNLWLLALAGDRRAVPKFLTQLAQTTFKGRQVKMRKRGADGKVTIQTIT